jgi:hypothetical protein
MLTLDGKAFTTGESRFLDHRPTDPEQSPKIYIKFRPAELETILLAQLDTGSPWSILEPEIAGWRSAFLMPMASRSDCVVKGPHLKDVWSESSPVAGG